MIKQKKVEHSMFLLLVRKLVKKPTEEHEMRTFFRYWSWGVVGAVCLAVGLSLFVRYSLEGEQSSEVVVFKTEKKSWISFVIDLTQKWQIEQIDQEQDVLLVEISEEKVKDWEVVAKDIISESFGKLQNVKSIRLRVVDQDQVTAWLICIERPVWLDLVKKSKWSNQSLQEFNLSNDKKTTD